MPELKAVQRHFGTIATSSLQPFIHREVIESWRPAASKIRVFGPAYPAPKGVSFVKYATPRPTLKSVFQDHYLGQRSTGVVLLTDPNVIIKPIAKEIYEYAEKKNMGIAWAFYASVQFSPFPDVIGVTTPVAKILSQEAPDDIYFDLGWQDWLYKWINKYMQSHRQFDVSYLGLVSPAVNHDAICLSDLTEEQAEDLSKAMEPVPVKEEKPKKRGRPKKVAS